GKSHLLAKVAEDALQQGSPVLLFLGQDFIDNDPRSLMLSRVDQRARSFDEFLGALDAAAASTDTRALLLNDALNEGNGVEIWPSELSPLLADFPTSPRT